jgi:hypothetical protein
MRQLFFFLYVVVLAISGTIASAWSEENLTPQSSSRLIFSELKLSEPDKMKTPPNPVTPVTPSASSTEHKVALFSGLDKVTGRNVSFEVASGEKVQFGGIYLKANMCVTRLRNDTPEDEAFVQIWEIQKKNTAPKNLFNGWMLAASPGLNTLEHPIYAIWLIGCR